MRDRVALITGGGRGIGEAIARRFAAEGARLFLTSRTPKDLERVALETGANFDICDVTQPKEIGALVRKIGPVDILVNNAGIAIVRGLDDLSEDEFDRTIASNLKSAFLCTQAVLPGMRARRWGRIVNISSIGARVGAGSVSVAYAAAKAGIEGLTRGYALRLAAEGITVNAVAPGLVDTEMGQPLIAAGVPARIPVGRPGTGDEIAQAVMMLVRNSYITGQTIAVNGGSLFS